jgi:hypothetical protein
MTVVGGAPQPTITELEVVSYPDANGVFTGTFDHEPLIGAIAPLMSAGGARADAYTIGFHWGYYRTPPLEEPHGEQTYFIQFFHGVIVGDRSATDPWKLDNARYMSGRWHRTFPMLLVQEVEKLGPFQVLVPKVETTHTISGIWTATSAPGIS